MILNKLTILDSKDVVFDYKATLPYGELPSKISTKIL